jgi:hypothetical protein
MYKLTFTAGKTESSDFLLCLHLRSIDMDFAQSSIKSTCLFGAVDKSTLIEIFSLCIGFRSISLAIYNDTFNEDGMSLLRVWHVLLLKALVSAMMSTKCHL